MILVLNDDRFVGSWSSWDISGQLDTFLGKEIRAWLVSCSSSVFEAHLTADFIVNRLIPGAVVVVCGVAVVICLRTRRRLPKDNPVGLKD